MTQKTIVIVEDDFHAQNILKDLLSHYDFDVKIFNQGTTANNYLQQYRCDLVILDLMLPDIDGLEVLKKLRMTDSTCNNIPVIILSATGADVEQRISGLKLGADDFMSKPYHPGELLARVINLLYKAVHEENHQLSVLNTVADAITSTMDISLILKEVVKISCNALKATSAYICDIDEHKKTTTVLAEYISDSAHPKEVVSDLGVTYNLETDFPGLWKWAVTKMPDYVQHIDDPDIDPCDLDEMKSYGAKSILAVPFQIDDMVVGYIEIWESREKRIFTKNEISLIEAIASQLAMALRRSGLFAELRESEKRYRDLFENAHDIIQITDDANCFQHVNHSWVKTLGYSYKETRELCFEDILRKDQRAKFHDIRQTLLSRQAIEAVELILVTKAHEEIIVECNFTANVVDNQLVSIQGILRDITEKKELQEQSLHLNIERERVQILKRYVNAIAHDFRTPLSIIGTAAYLWAKSTNAEDINYFKRITSQIQHFKRLLEKISTLSELEQDITLKFIHINPIVQQIADQLIQKKTLQNIILLDIDDSIPGVYGKPKILAEALSHIVENALDYSSENGNVIIRTYHQQETVIVEIKDAGIGISADTLDKIFEPFFRGDTSRNLDQQHSGLGLSLAKRIIEIHGGRVEVSSVPGEGSIFQVVLPAVTLHE